LHDLWGFGWSAGGTTAAEYGRYLRRLYALEWKSQWIRCGLVAVNAFFTLR
jgi:hypothetical protein